MDYLPIQPMIKIENNQPKIKEEKVKNVLKREIVHVESNNLKRPSIYKSKIQPSIEKKIQPKLPIAVPVINDNKINNIKNENNSEEEKEEEEEKNEKETNSKKCSLDEHKEMEALFYCQECRVNMCNKCEKTHSGFLKHHHIYSLDKDISEIFTGLCTNKNHSLELEIYCKTHNQLCCVACISKIKIKGKSQHKNCELYHIKKIKNKKKENLEKNIKYLEELSNTLEPSIKELKNIYEKINNSKDKLKEEIQKIFTKIRNELNNREDILYEEIDKKFSEIFFKEELIKQSEKLPNLVKISLDKGKIQENEWNDENKLSKLIYDTINIENTIQKIDVIYSKIKEYNSNKDIDIEFEPTIKKIENSLIKDIKNFGGIKVIKKKNIEQIINIDNNLIDINDLPTNIEPIDDFKIIHNDK